MHHWFTEALKPTLDKLDLAEKPDRVFYVDESGFPLSGKPGMVLAMNNCYYINNFVFTIFINMQLVKINFKVIPLEMG